MRKILVTGAGGLIGSEVVRFFCEKGVEVVGIDNNMRQVFLGKKGTLPGTFRN
jgi:CDP-paratose 2-epimerase